MMKTLRTCKINPQTISAYRKPFIATTTYSLTSSPSSIIVARKIKSSSQETCTGRKITEYWG